MYCFFFFFSQLLNHGIRLSPFSDCVLSIPFPSLSIVQGNRCIPDTIAFQISKRLGTTSVLKIIKTTATNRFDAPATLSFAPVYTDNLLIRYFH